MTNLADEVLAGATSHAAQTGPAKTWRLDRSIPVTLLVLLALQAEGAMLTAVWWLSAADKRLTTVESAAQRIDPLVGKVERMVGQLDTLIELRKASRLGRD